MAFISKEIPTGAVDSVNMIYTLSQNINQIDDIWVDGAIYLGSFSVAGAVVTLTNSPTTSIYIDYYTSPPSSLPYPGYIQLSEARTNLGYLLKDISDVPQATFIQWANFINKFLWRKLCATDPERFIKTSAFPTYSGTTNYTLPTDFRDITEFRCGLFLANAQTGLPTEQKLTYTGYGSQIQGFFITGLTTLTLTPQPQQNINYFLRYIPRITTLSVMEQFFSVDGSTASMAVVAEEYMDYLVKALAVAYAVWDEEIGAESFADQRFMRVLEEIIQYIRRDPGTYNVTDFSNTF